MLKFAKVVGASFFPAALLIAAGTLAAGACSAHAQELLIKNDNLPAFDPDDPITVSAGLNSNFDADEKAAGVFSIPAAYRPCIVKRVQVLWLSQSQQTGNIIHQALEVWRGDVLNNASSPTRIFSSLDAPPDGFSPQLTDGAMNEFNLSTFNVIIPATSTRFTFALVFDSNTSAPQGPTVAVDLNGITGGRNAVYGTIPPFIVTPQWFDAATVGLQGDFVMRAVIDKYIAPPARCQPADIADDQGNAIGSSAAPNSGVNEGDYNRFFNTFFTQQTIGSPCDIADDAGTPLPPFANGGQPPAVNSGVNEGDYNAFFNHFFLGC
ncbi:hypothetical protein BH11PLA1_BH11PLA1_19580 [soil metagenome]